MLKAKAQQARICVRKGTCFLFLDSKAETKRETGLCIAHKTHIRDDAFIFLDSIDGESLFQAKTMGAAAAALLLLSLFLLFCIYVWMYVCMYICMCVCCNIKTNQGKGALTSAIKQFALAHRKNEINSFL
jgi:hypothetical protein